MRRPSSILRNAVAIGSATGVYGVSFGVVAVGAGLSVTKTCVMSLLVFTGASQFAAVGVVASGGTAAAVLAPALLLAARNAAYGLTLAPLMPRGRVRRALEAQLVIDESTAMARAHEHPEEAHRAFLVTGISVFAFWNFGTLLGALAGNVIGDPGRLGLDAMFPAAIVALLGPQLRRPAARPVAALGALIALALVPIAPPGVPILFASLGLLAALRTLRQPHRRDPA